ncbi:hypothetical protein RCH14_004849, partial [Massilia sp. MP_M2]|uniref:hypothetical protein n=1 Tax=Massilia sp. MP_M2 TaxID=3071713 RepID=UPI00319D8DA7
MRNHSLGGILAVFAFFALSMPVDSAAGSENFIDRPWEIRYVLFAEDASLMRAGLAYSQKSNKQQTLRGKQKIYLSASALFEIAATFAVPGEEALGIILLTFDRAGRVVSKKGALSSMSAKRTRLDRLVLIHNDIPDPNPYH